MIDEQALIVQRLLLAVNGLNLQIKDAVLRGKLRVDLSIAASRPTIGQLDYETVELAIFEKLGSNA